MREALARRMSAEIAPLAWIIDDTGFPKAGRYSVGVARQYSGTLGKVGNCQIGVSVSAASEAGRCPLDWRLFLPAAWDEDATERRAKAHLPQASVTARSGASPWRCSTSCAAGESSPPPVVADAGYGEITAFRAPSRARARLRRGGQGARPAPTARRSLPSSPPGAGPGRPPQPRYRQPPVSLRALALAAGSDAACEVVWREGSRGPMAARFLALRCRPANVGLRRAHGAEGCRSLAALRVARGRGRADQVLAGQPARRDDAATWCAWPSCAGASSSTTASSRTRSASTTSRGARFAAGTTTSRSSAWRTASSPWSEPGAHSQGGSLTLFSRPGATALLACWQGTCPTCRGGCRPSTNSGLHQPNGALLGGSSETRHAYSASPTALRSPRSFAPIAYSVNPGSAVALLWSQ